MLQGGGLQGPLSPGAEVELGPRLDCVLQSSIYPLGTSRRRTKAQNPPLHQGELGTKVAGKREEAFPFLNPASGSEE